MGILFCVICEKIIRKYVFYKHRWYGEVVSLQKIKPDNHGFLMQYSY